MITIYSADHEQHNPPLEFTYGTLHTPLESPQRAANIQAAIEQAALGPTLAPRSFGLEHVTAVHDPRYVAYLEHAYEHWVADGWSTNGVLPETLAVRWMSREPTNSQAAAGYYAFDLGAPIVAGTFPAARSAANVALTCAALLLEGEQVVYALCRPPGHHAGTDMCGGFCYLNNAAIAAEYLVRHTTPEPPARVAILDVDFHHCNGTQQIFYSRDDVFVVSLHADPNREYPSYTGYADERGAGAGEGYNLNFPLEQHLTNQRYLETLDQALAAVAAYAPTYLVISAGFDIYEGDPYSDFALTPDIFDEIGKRCAALSLPMLVVQEGGYAIEMLGDLAVRLLRGCTTTRQSS